MAVKHKTGLDYFPFDIDFFADEKVEFIAARFGIKGELIAVKLLCRIYRNGFFTEWTEDDAIMFAKRVGDGVTPALVNDVVDELAKRDFFDKRILCSFKVLTSKGIQKRYFDAVERRKSIDAAEHLLLVDVAKYKNVNIQAANVDILEGNAGSEPTKESKVNRKESRGEDGGASAPTHKSFKKFSDEEFKAEIRGANVDLKLPSPMLHKFFNYWTERSASGLMKFQLEKTWDTKRRLETWRDNQAKFERNGNKHSGTNQVAVSTGRTLQRDAL